MKPLRMANPPTGSPNKAWNRRRLKNKVVASAAKKSMTSKTSDIKSHESAQVKMGKLTIGGVGIEMIMDASALISPHRMSTKRLSKND